MVPVSVFQMLFALVNPIQAALKFQKLARLDPDGPAARLFVALEDWLADGVPMPVGAAKDLLVGWQIRNPPPPAAGASSAARSIRARSRAPALVVLRRNDTIAPPAAGPPARPGAARAPRTSRPRTGHVGMIVGSAARVAGLATDRRVSSPPMQVEHCDALYATRELA